MKDINQQAQGQHALVRRAQLLELGYSVGQIERLVSGGRLDRIGRSVYRIPGSVSTYRQRLLAAVWAAGPGAVASHQSAATLWGLPGFSDRSLHVARIHHRRDVCGVVHHESCFLPSHHRGTVDSIPVTVGARTVFDLCGAVHPGRADRALENALKDGLVTDARMEIVLAECARQGRNGVTVLRALLAKRNNSYVPTESELERLVVAVLEGAGLPVPERQVVLGSGDVVAGRVDFLYRDANLVIEADGRQHGGWLATAEDARRDAILRAGGYEVMRVTWRMLTEEPELFIAAVRSTLRRRVA